MGKDKKKKEKDKSKKKQKSGKALKKNQEMLLNENVTSQKETDARYDWHDWDDDDDDDGMGVESEDRRVNPELEEVPDGAKSEPEVLLSETAPESEELLDETDSESEELLDEMNQKSETVQTVADREPETAQTKADNAPKTTQTDIVTVSDDIEEFPVDRKKPVITNGVSSKARRRKKQTLVEGDTSVSSAEQIQSDQSPFYAEKISDAAVLAIFQALSDENRVKIMNLLAEREMCTSELLEAVNVVQSTMSHHMKVLCEAGLVSMRRQGKRSCYAVRRDTLDQVEAYIKDWKA